MEPDAADILLLDIEKNKYCLQQILEAFLKQTASLEMAREGLMAAHTLKALAAVKGMAHLENYAAQLEQVFLQAQKMDPQTFQTALRPLIQTIQQEFAQALAWLEEQAPKDTSPPASQALSQFITQLRDMEARQFNVATTRVAQTALPSETNIIQVFKSFEPWLYHAAQSQQKQVQLALEITKPTFLSVQAAATLQTILIHLLRNAIFHGVERPEDRKRLGKLESAVIQLTAEHDGPMLIISVSDDGQGLASTGATHITESPAAVSPGTGAHGSESTAVETSIYAAGNCQTGLGIGLHIVQSHIKKLGGTFQLKSIPGVGTSAIASIPLCALKGRGNV